MVHRPVIRSLLFFPLIAGILSCSSGAGQQREAAPGNAFAAFFELLPDAAVSISPFTGDRDTLRIDGPMDNIVCMSTSHVAFLSETDRASAITGVSGAGFLSDPELKGRQDLAEVGYDATFDYEMVMRLDPDVVLAYSVSSVEPQYVSRLRSMGISVFVLYDHLEQHPLARAEYVRVAGALTGARDVSDSLFRSVSEKYMGMAAAVADSIGRRPESGSAGGPILDSHVRPGVLLNLPYSDMWYVPGAENYMSALIRDAGGEVLGAAKGSAASSVISVEDAYRLSRKADFWLNTGNCTSRKQIESLHPLFPRFGPMRRTHSVFNNVARVNAAGGNDFWESGAAHPEMILSDLIAIFRGEAGDGSALHYYIEVE